MMNNRSTAIEEAGRKNQFILKVGPIRRTGISMKDIFDCFFGFYLLLNFQYYFIEDRPVFARLRLLALIVCSIIGIYYFCINSRNTQVVLFIAFFLFSWIFVSMFKTDGLIYGMNYFRYTFLHIWAALGLVSFKHRVLLYRLIFYIMHFYLLIQLAVFRVNLWAIIKTDTSYNFISVFCLFYFILYIVVFYQNNKVPSLFDFVLYFAVSILGRSRATIIVAMVAAMLFVIVTFARERNKFRKFFGFAALALSSPFLIKYLFDYFNLKGYLSKFYMLRFDSNGRIEIWKSYLKTCTRSVLDFMLGGDAGFMGEDGNLHNGFLQIWSFFGFFVFVAFIILVLLCMIYFIKHKYYFIWIALTLLVIRSMTDKTIFYGPNEICLFYFLFFYLMDRKILRQTEIIKEDI